MVKTIVSSLVALLILITFTIYEADFVSRQFVEFSEILNVLYEKIEDETAIEDDVYAVQENWVEKKKYLHIFIPHNDIKEIDLWVAETVKLVKEEKWEDSLSKVEVLIELSEQTPKSFILSVQNIL